MQYILTKKKKLLIHEGLIIAQIIRMHREINYFMYLYLKILKLYRNCNFKN